MYCPECKAENKPHATQCVACGCVLTQVRLTEQPAHRTNQVWNTDIDQEKNRRNSRTALVLLGVTAVLIAVLAAALVLYIPQVTAVFGEFSLPEIDLSELFGSREIAAAPQPEPDWDTPAASAVAVGETDLEFLVTAENFLTEFYYADDSERPEVVMGYVPAFEAYDLRLGHRLPNGMYTMESTLENPELQDLAIGMLAAVWDMSAGVSYTREQYPQPYVSDEALWEQGYFRLCETVEMLYEGYGLLSYAEEIPIYYIAYITAVPE